MLPDGAVHVDQVWKRFRSDRHRNLLRDEFSRLKGRLQGENSKGWRWAVRDMSFDVEPGTSLALVGSNGSGKSTMLKMLVGVMFPTYGSITAAGRIGALIEVKAGIHPDLTGRENVFMFGTLLGLGRTEVRKRFDEIVRFAELEDAIDRQVKFYSSGMGMRLGFAVAAFLEPDVLVVDEVLAVGDAAFQQRCLDRMRDVMAGGTTLLYVSHDLATVESMCQEAIWMDQGVGRAIGPTREVVGEYRRHVENLSKDQHAGSEVSLTLLGLTDRDGGPAVSNRAAEVSLSVTSSVARQIRVVIGFSEGSPSPAFLAEDQRPLPAGESALHCSIANLPLPAGRFAVWATALDAGGRTLSPWEPIGDFTVRGPELLAAPTGVVRLSPVVVEASWRGE
jgi:ABC-2 type transport system ATP-binding protein